jgi:hypothetical protein
MPMLCLAMAFALAPAGARLAQAAAPEAGNSAATEDTGRLVREVVYNELHDHAQHGYFRYWIERNLPGGTSLEEQVETASGPVTRTLEWNGRPLQGRQAEQEQARLNQLRDSPSEQAQRRAAFEQDEERIGKILALLPEAFVYRDEGIADGVRRLHFTPNPNYTARGVEARVFHCLSGELWIDLRTRRMRQLEGHLDQNVEFGFGLLARVDKGSWFRMVRAPVNASEWKTEQFELHISGRALMLKTLARNTSEERGGFAAVPARMSLAQGLQFLDNPALLRDAAARVAPASFTVKP